MRGLRSFGLVLLMASAVHVDWHIGRAAHDRLSLGWRYHWALGVASFALVTWLVLRPGRSGRLWQLALLLLLGLAAGQILEPIGEVLVYQQPWDVVMPAERWRVFYEFTAAGLVTTALLAGVRRK